MRFLIGRGVEENLALNQSARGSTAGGTTVRLAVEGLPADATTADVDEVTIDGAICTVASVNAPAGSPYGNVTCVTTSYGRTSLSLIHI